MATKPVAPQIDSSLLKFDPKWVFDPAPPWLRDYLKGDLLKKHLELQLEAQGKLLQVQADFVNQSLEMVRKSK
jgi:hypothetical protein